MEWQIRVVERSSNCDKFQENSEWISIPVLKLEFYKKKKNSLVVSESYRIFSPDVLSQDVRPIGGATTVIRR
jgi:hypothetical protein